MKIDITDTNETKKKTGRLAQIGSLICYVNSKKVAEELGACADSRPIEVSLKLLVSKCQIV